MPEVVSAIHPDAILVVENLHKRFPVQRGWLRRKTGEVRALDSINLVVRRCETVGIVGESGCGKTTFGRSILRAIEPTEGSIRLRVGEKWVDITHLPERELRQYRKAMQLIFQDPYSSLDPRMSVYDILSEPLIATGQMSKEQIRERVYELMGLVGLDLRHLRRYPHAFSGGQRQRIGIARALATNPSLIVCDEAVSALDVSIQAQVLNLLQDLQEQLGLTYIFIAHDLSVVQHLCDRVAVMYLGRIVEIAETRDLYSKPRHPYTEALLSAVPDVDTRDKRQRIVLSGEVANPADAPAGCPFHPRCRYATALCSAQRPEAREVAPGHFAACHFSDELALAGIPDAITIASPEPPTDAP